MKFPEDFINQFIIGDALEVMQKIPDGSIDLIVTSPPYNIRNSTGARSSEPVGFWSKSTLLNKGYESHSDDLPHDAYVKWQRECLTEMMRIIPENGAIFYNHKWRVQGGLLQDRQDIVSGFPVRQILIWYRNGGINFNEGYFLPTYEVIYLIAKPDFRLLKSGVRHGDVWYFLPESGSKHPAPFPVQLVERIIASTRAKIVLDPFIGSGTTAVAAKNLCRDFVGIDNSAEYCNMAKQRLAQQSSTLPGILTHEAQEHLF